MRSGLPALAAVLLISGCTHVMAGRPGPGSEPAPDVAAAAGALLTQDQLRAITGAGEDLTVIPTMDAAYPVDDDNLAALAPPDCRFVFAETATFGTEFTGFHKTTYQNPPARSVISQAVALYPDPVAARRAFDTLGAGTAACAGGPSGILVGGWTSGDDWLRMRPGDCGRDYRLKSVALVEVTFCGLPESVPEIVMTAIVGRLPG